MLHLFAAPLFHRMPLFSLACTAFPKQDAVRKKHSTVAEALAVAARIGAPA
jgi:ribonuclease BN (tRNA processing enzyme)